MTFVYCFLIFFVAVCYQSHLSARVKLMREATRLAELQVIASGFAVPPRGDESEEKKAEA